jgi:AcrR family transcriptional regulator
VAATRTETPAPRKRDGERTRAAILKAATREFSTHGFSGARTERIAALAKCNIRLLYHHFGNKKALYMAVIETAYEDLRTQEAALVFDYADPTGCVEQLTRFTFRYFQEHPYFEGLLRSENMMKGKYVRQLKSVPEAAANLRGVLRAIVAAGEATGEFRPGIDPDHLYVTITAFSRFHLSSGDTLSNLLQTDMHSAEWRAGWLEHAVRLIRAYVRADADRPAV